MTGIWELLQTGAFLGTLGIYPGCKEILAVLLKDLSMILPLKPSTLAGTLWAMIKPHVRKSLDIADLRISLKRLTCL